MTTFSILKKIFPKTENLTYTLRAHINQTQKYKRKEAEEDKIFSVVRL